MISLKWERMSVSTNKLSHLFSEHAEKEPIVIKDHLMIPFQPLMSQHHQNVDLAMDFSLLMGSLSYTQNQGI